MKLKLRIAVYLIFLGFLAAAAAWFVLCYPYHISVAYDGPDIYQYDPVDTSKVDVGIESILHRPLEADPEIRYDTNGDFAVIKVRQNGMTAEAKVECIKVSGVSAEYSGSTKEGDAIRKEDVLVAVTYEDGTKRPVDDFELSAEKISTEPVTVTTMYGKASFQVNPWTGVEGSYDGFLYAGLLPQPDRLHVELLYADGTKESIPADKLTMPTEDLKETDTSFTVGTDYGDAKCDVKVYPDTTPIRKAYQDQADDSVSSEIIGPTFYVSKKEADGATIYHVMMNDLSKQLLIGEGDSALSVPYKDSGAGQLIEKSEAVTEDNTNGNEIGVTMDGFWFRMDPDYDVATDIANGVTDIIRTYGDAEWVEASHKGVAIGFGSENDIYIVKVDDPSFAFMDHITKDAVSNLVWLVKDETADVTLNKEATGDSLVVRLQKK